MDDFIKNFSNYWDIASKLSPLLVGGFLLWMRSKFPTRKEYEDDNKIVAAKMDAQAKLIEGHTIELLGIDSQLQLIEKDLKEIPTRDTIHKLQLEMERFNGKLEVAGQKFENLEDINKRFEKQVDRMDDFLKTRT